MGRCGGADALVYVAQRGSPDMFSDVYQSQIEKFKVLANWVHALSRRCNFIVNTLVFVKILTLFLSF